MSRRRRWFWPATLIGCLLLAAWLMSGADPPPPKEVAVPAFPRFQTPEDKARADARKKPRPSKPSAPLPPPDDEPPSEVPPPAPAEAPPTPHRDPVMTALSRPGGGSALVMEANVLLHSPVGEMILGCMDASAKAEIDDVRQRFGVDLFSSIDRVAVQEGLLAVSGHFAEAEWETIFEGMKPEEHGDFGMVYSQPELSQIAEDLDEPLAREPVVGVWNDELVFLGDSAEEVQAAMDRLEGAAPAGPPPIADREAYGEIYGNVRAEDFTKLLAGGDQGELADLLKRAAERVELHVDARDDVALVARARGPDAQAMDELSRSLGGLLSLGRIQARREGDDELAGLLEHAKVSPFEGDSTVELALPQATLREWLGECAQPAKAAPAERPAGDAP